MELLKEPYLLSSFFIQIHSERHIEQLQERSVTGFQGEDPNKLPTADSICKLLKHMKLFNLIFVNYNTMLNLYLCISLFSTLVLNERLIVIIYMVT